MPRHVYLAWQSDPATTMTVNVQTEEPAAVEVRYGTKSGTYRHSASGGAYRLEKLPTVRFARAVELVDMEPATTYYFIAGDSSTGYSAEHTFVTVPDHDRPIRCVVVGDMGVSERVERLEVVAANVEPLFCVLGGDLANFNGNPQQWQTWDRWLDSWQDNMHNSWG